jgi:hypothetical protein
VLAIDSMTSEFSRSYYVGYDSAMLRAFSLDFVEGDSGVNMSHTN